MAITTKIAVTLPGGQLDEVRAIVASGRSPSISAFVKHAIEIAIWEGADWREMLDDALRQTGGRLTKSERAWADKILAAGRKKGGRQAE